MQNKSLLAGANNMYLISAGISLLAIVVAMLIGAVLIALAGINPFYAYWHMFYGAIGNMNGIAETLNKFAPLVFCAMGFALAQKSGFFNMGAEGQLYAGALGAVLVGGYIQGLPSPVHIAVSLLAAFLLGSLCSFLAGALKIMLGVSELLNTMMLNYIIILFVDLLLQTSLKDPSSMMNQSVAVMPSSKLPFILQGTRMHLGAIIAVAAVLIVWFFYQKTVTGFEMRLAGSNMKAASYSGINTTKSLFLAILISGGLAGLGGGVELLGSQHRLMPGFSPGYGFDAVGIAVMGQYNPFGIILSALLFAVLRVGAGAMQRGMGVPLPLVSVLQGIIIVMVIISSYFTKKLSETVIGGRA